MPSFVSTYLFFSPSIFAFLPPLYFLDCVKSRNYVFLARFEEISPSLPLRDVEPSNFVKDKASVGGLCFFLIWDYWIRKIALMMKDRKIMGFFVLMMCSFHSLVLINSNFNSIKISENIQVLLVEFWLL